MCSGLVNGVLWLKSVLCVPGWGGEPGGDGKWGELWLWFMPAGEWGRGGVFVGGGMFWFCVGVGGVAGV